MKAYTLNPKDSVVMQLNFPNLPDENIPIGQIVVLWGEIVCRKIGSNIYEVWDLAKLSESKIPSIGSIIERSDGRFGILESFKMVPDELSSTWFEEPKYIKKGHGSRKRKPWESPSFF